MLKAPAWFIEWGDCLERMAAMPAESVDAIVTDPPYGIASKGKVQTHGGKVCEAFDLAWDQSLDLRWIEPGARLLKPGGSLVAFVDTKRVDRLWAAVEAAGLRPLQVIFWIKANPPPQPRKNFQSAVEAGVFARKPGALLHWGGGGATPNAFHFPIAAGHDRTAHPTQKPLGLMREIVKLIAAPGALVLDPFCGSGTTIAAAVLESRDSIGIELSEEYARIARARVAAWERTDGARQIGLFK